VVVNFTRVVARDCFAYKYLDFRFENGIHSVIGNNGASKTSLFLTLIQGLFNQNPKGTKIADVNNEITGQPYEIEIWFTKGASEWHVKNSKKTGEIEIYEEVNGAKHKRNLKRIPDNLKFIELFDFRGSRLPEPEKLPESSRILLRRREEKIHLPR